MLSIHFRQAFSYILLLAICSCRAAEPSPSSVEENTNSLASIGVSAAVPDGKMMDRNATEEKSVFSRLIGTLKHDALGFEQLAKLDFVTHRDRNGTMKIAAVLGLYFGDFNSGEYVNFHYDDVSYDLLTGRMVFSQPDQDFSFTIESISAESISASVRSAVGGDGGILKLQRASDQPNVQLSMPLLPKVWGEYSGTCNNVKTQLHLQTTRSAADTFRTGNPFAANDIRAQLLTIDPELCPARSALEPAPYCVKGFYAGTYNFYQGTIDLEGAQSTPGVQPKQCVVGVDSLKCGDCELKRLNSRDQRGPTTAFPTATAGFPKLVPSQLAAESLSGEYVGYLHHEYLNQYQTASISLRTASGSEGGSLNVLPVARLYFGDRNSREVLSYSFDQQYYQLISGSQIVLMRPADDVDAMIKITSLADGVLRGVWYSIRFGRVGEFYLSKSGNLTLPDGAIVMKSVSGKYNSPKSVVPSLNIIVKNGSTPVGTENPFYPLEVTGFFSLDGTSLRSSFIGGTYDFYTGRIGFGEKDAGQVSAGGKTIQVKWNPKVFLGTLPRQPDEGLNGGTLNTYNRVEQ